MLSIRVAYDPAPEIRAIAISAHVRPEDIATVAGRAAVNLLRDHFRTLDATEPNRLGGKRTHYWSAAARSVHQTLIAGGVRVSINQPGVALAYFGGVVKPINSRLLTIPNVPEAHGRRAAEFTDLKIAYGARGPFALVKREQSTLEFHKGKKKSRFVSVTTRGQRDVRTGLYDDRDIIYWLVKEVTIKPDASVLPAFEQLDRAVTTQVRAFIHTQVMRWKG